MPGQTAGAGARTGTEVVAKSIRASPQRNDFVVIQEFSAGLSGRVVGVRKLLAVAFDT
jgi:hypothetical protein